MTGRHAARRRRRPEASDEHLDDHDGVIEGGVSLSERVLLGLIVALPLLLGGVHPEVRLSALALALVALSVKVWRRRGEGRPLLLGPWGAALLVAAGVAALQWIPLPAALTGAISPERLAVAERLAAALGEPPPGWLPLGLDPGRVAGGLAGLGLALAVHLLALNGRTGDAARVRVVIALELAAALAVGVGALHAGLGWEGLFNLYGGAAAGGPFPATFVNSNHLAALCLLAALAAFGAAIGDKQRAVWHAAMAAVASFGVLASMSRANALLLVGGLGLVALPWLGLRSPFRRRGSPSAAGADSSSGAGPDEPPERVVRARRLSIGLVALVFIALVFAGPDRWAIELGTLLPGPDGDAAPLSARFGVISGCWWVVTAVCEAFPLAGVGLGNLALATPAFVEDWTTGRITHAHHAALEVAAELGLPAALIIGGLTLAGFLLAWRHRGDPLPWACLVALGALVAQNFVDFSLWMPGVGVPAMALAGLVARGRRSSSPSPSRWQFGLRAALALAPGALALPGALFLAPPSAVSAASPDRLSASQADAPADWRALVRDHGADFSVLEVASALAEREGDGVAARKVAEAALALNPNGPGPLTRAFKFAVLDGQDARAVALLERLFTQGSAGQEAALTLALAAAARPAIPAGFLGFEPARVLRAVELLRARGEGEAARELIGWALGALGHHLPLVEAWVQGVPRTLAQADTLGAIGSLCLAEAARRAAEGLPLAADWERLGLYVEGEREVALGHPLAAWSRFMASAATGLPDATSPVALAEAAEDLSTEARAARERALYRAAEVAAEVDRLDRLEESLALIEPLVPSQPWARIRRHALRSHRFALRGETRNAIRELQQALRLAPDDPSFHRRLAPLFEQLGDLEAASRSLARAEAIEAAVRERRPR
jgi:Flp pilus assembly protein TadD